MDKFFESYRNKAEADRNLPFKEADWNLLEKKLNQKKYILFPIPPILWPISTAVSLITLAFFYLNPLPVKKLNTTSELLTQDSLFSPSITNRHDTIYVDKALYIIKTVNKYIYKNSSLASIQNQPDPIISQSDQSEIKSLILKNQKLQDMIVDQEKQLHSLKQELTKNTNQPLIPIPISTDLEHSINKSDPGVPVSEFSSGLPLAKDLEVPISVSLPLAGDTLNRWQKFMQSFSPIGLDWSLQGGVPLLLNNQIKNQLGYIISTKTNLVLKSGIELQAGLTYSKMKYETLIMDKRLGVPVQNAPKNDFTFYKAEVWRPSMNVDLVLYYNLVHHKKLTPLVGIGIGYFIPLLSKVGYDFIALASPEEYPIDITYLHKVKNPYSIQWHGALKYTLGSRWSIAAQTTLYNKIRKDDFLSSRIDLSAGIVYRLY